MEPSVVSAPHKVGIHHGNSSTLAISNSSQSPSCSNSMKLGLRQTRAHGVRTVDRFGTLKANKPKSNSLLLSNQWAIEEQHWPIPTLDRKHGTTLHPSSQCREILNQHGVNKPRPSSSPRRISRLSLGLSRSINRSSRRSKDKPTSLKLTLSQTLRDRLCVQAHKRVYIKEVSEHTVGKRPRLVLKPRHHQASQDFCSEILRYTFI